MSLVRWLVSKAHSLSATPLLRVVRSLTISSFFVESITVGCVERDRTRRTSSTTDRTTGTRQRGTASSGPGRDLVLFGSRLLLGASLFRQLVSAVLSLSTVALRVVRRLTIGGVVVWA
jgi:hypothetical protein